MLSFHNTRRGTERCQPVAMNRNVEAPLVIHPYSLVYEQFRLQITLFALKIVICPYTRYDDIMVLIRPLIVGLVGHANQPINEIFMVTMVAQPSIHPQFAVITLFEDAILN